jgi:hypothetical protein
METCGISGEEKRDAWRVVAGVLHLGNVTFKNAGKDSSNVDSVPSMLACAQQLGVSGPELEKCLTRRTIRTGTEAVEKLLDETNAAHPCGDGHGVQTVDHFLLRPVLRARRQGREVRHPGGEQGGPRRVRVAP